jgi:hypothetical protein
MNQQEGRITPEEARELVDALYDTVEPLTDDQLRALMTIIDRLAYEPDGGVRDNSAHNLMREVYSRSEAFVRSQEAFLAEAGCMCVREENFAAA